MPEFLDPARKMATIRFRNCNTNANLIDNGNYYARRSPYLMLKTVLVPIHPAGWPFIAIFAALAAGMAWWHQPLGYLGAVLTAWCVYFFRNPERITPTRAGLVISPADGVVQSICEAVPPAELDMGEAPRTRIAVFMNVFNVHVNRVPIDGTISATSYRPGKFFNASLDKASIDNERQSLKVTVADGREVAFVQIAGLVARRIICWAKLGDQMKAGERFGLIRFGSRVDVYLPDGAQPLVAIGQTAVAGETVLADLGAEGVQTETAARLGEIR
jgi:phosphatidylserine decarboxylase